MIAEIVLNSSAIELGNIYDYQIPDEYSGTVTVGQKVTVPFGVNNGKKEGYIVGLKGSSEVKRLKAIQEFHQDVLTEKQLYIAKFISQKYYCNLGAAMALFCVDELKRKSKGLNNNIDEIEEDNIANAGQKQAIDYLKAQIDLGKFDEILLHGVTGSGKTEVYLQVAKYLLKLNKSVIVLVPEISLTPQTVNRFRKRLGNNVAVLHSRLSKGEKYSEWIRIKNGEAKIVIGARSALFAPVTDLGMIIIDEEHDMSYKSGQTPYYHAREVAEEICKINNSLLLLGSATPDITTYYKARCGDIKMIRLTKRANSKSALPTVKIVNMAQELVNNNKTIISNELYQSIKENIAKKEQTILFLNRRGYSSFINCRECGFVAKCRRCNIALTYHSTTNKLICHYCGAKYNMPTVCPVCKTSKIKSFGTGTEKIEEIIQKLFPEASLLRMDLDTTGKKGAHEEILSKFKNEKVDILIGTQMIAKGHDFPNVTLVGVISADMSLNINDFRAAERTFNLITQVSGRAGRGEKAGKVIIQTYESDNYSIVASQNHDYESFYNQEIIIREKLNYPPFSDIIMIHVTGENEKNVINTANSVQAMFLNGLRDFEDVMVFPAVPAPISKINNKFRWRIIIKCKITDEINNVINYLIKSEKFVKIKSAELAIDVNPAT